VADETVEAAEETVSLMDEWLSDPDDDRGDSLFESVSSLRNRLCRAT
jgi:hypothetical protein